MGVTRTLQSKSVSKEIISADQAMQQHHYFYCLHCHHLKFDIIIINAIVVVFVIFVAYQLLGALGPPWSEDGERMHGTAGEYCSSALQ